MKSKSLFLALAAVSVLALSAPPAHAENWEFDLGVYGWLAGIDGTIGAGNVGDVPVKASFSDLAGFVDFSMGLSFEARQPKYIIGADGFWVNLSETRTAQIEGGAELDIDLSMKEYIGALGGAYRVTPLFDVWLTGRMYTIKSDADWQGSSLDEQSHTWADIYVGARYHREFAQRWLAAVRADIGTGGSDFAWYGDALLGFRFTPTFMMGAGYRVLSLDRVEEDGDYFKWDIAMNGLGIFMNFSW